MISKVLIVSSSRDELLKQLQYVTICCHLEVIIYNYTCCAMGFQQKKLPLNVRYKKQNKIPSVLRKNKRHKAFKHLNLFLYYKQMYIFLLLIATEKTGKNPHIYRYQSFKNFYTKWAQTVHEYYYIYAVKCTVVYIYIINLWATSRFVQIKQQKKQ